MSMPPKCDLGKKGGYSKLDTPIKIFVHYASDDFC